MDASSSSPTLTSIKVLGVSQHCSFESKPSRSGCPSSHRMVSLNLPLRWSTTPTRLWNKLLRLPREAEPCRAIRMSTQSFARTMMTPKRREGAESPVDKTWTLGFPRLPSIAFLPKMMTGKRTSVSLPFTYHFSSTPPPGPAPGRQAKDVETWHIHFSSSSTENRHAR